MSAGPNGESCATCYYADEVGSQGKQVARACRINPPVPVLLSVSTKPTPGNVAGTIPVIQGMQPPAETWCGKWTVKPGVNKN